MGRPKKRREPEASRYTSGPSLRHALSAWDQGRWEECCRHMQIALMQGSRKRAIAAMDHYCCNRQILRLEKESSVEDLRYFGLEARVAGKLSERFKTIESLLYADDIDLNDACRARALQVSQIDAALELAGFKRACIKVKVDSIF